MSLDRGSSRLRIAHCIIHFCLSCSGSGVKRPHRTSHRITSYHARLVWISTSQHPDTRFLDFDCPTYSSICSRLPIHRRSSSYLPSCLRAHTPVDYHACAASLPSPIILPPSAVYRTRRSRHVFTRHQRHCPPNPSPLLPCLRSFHVFCPTQLLFVPPHRARSSRFGAPHAAPLYASLGCAGAVWARGRLISRLWMGAPPPPLRRPIVRSCTYSRGSDHSGSLRQLASLP